MTVFQTILDFFLSVGESLEVVDEVVDKEMTASHRHVCVKENLGRGADRKAEYHKCYTKKTAREMAKY